MKSRARRWFNCNGRTRSAPWTKKGRPESEKEPVKRCEIGRPQAGSVDDEKLLFQEGIFGGERFRTAWTEKSGKGDRM